MWQEFSDGLVGGAPLAEAGEIGRGRLPEEDIGLEGSEALLAHLVAQRGKVLQAAGGVPSNSP